MAIDFDDLVIAYTNKGRLGSIKLELCKNFKMKDLGQSCVVLGVYISHTRDIGTLLVCQSRCAQRTIERFGLESAKGYNTPIDDSAFDLCKMQTRLCNHIVRQ